jgi:hypothetical protein
VGLRSGQSLSLASLQLDPSVVMTVRVSMVYPAHANPGNLLRVVPASQLASQQVWLGAKLVDQCRQSQPASGHVRGLRLFQRLHNRMH